MDCAPPSEKQDNTNQNKRQAQARPQSESAPSAVKTEPGAERKTNDPIRREVAEHGRARIARAAKRAGGDGLEAIEKLEGSAGSEQESRAVNDGFIRRVHACDPSGE